MTTHAPARSPNEGIEFALEHLLPESVVDHLVEFIPYPWNKRADTVRCTYIYRSGRHKGYLCGLPRRPGDPCLTHTAAKCVSQRDFRTLLLDVYKKRVAAKAKAVAKAKAKAKPKPKAKAKA